jgi:hypothetical protein
MFAASRFLTRYSLEHGQRRVGLVLPLAFLAITSASGCSLLPDPTGVCDGVGDTLCAAAYAEAETRGLFLEAGQQVVSWRVRPTAAEDCPGGVDPLVDVVFELRNPTASVTISVGQLSNRTLAVCSY